MLPNFQVVSTTSVRSKRLPVRNTKKRDLELLVVSVKNQGSLTASDLLADPTDF